MHLSFSAKELAYFREQILPAERMVIRLVDYDAKADRYDVLIYREGFPFEWIFPADDGDGKNAIVSRVKNFLYVKNFFSRRTA